MFAVSVAVDVVRAGAGHQVMRHVVDGDGVWCSVCLVCLKCTYNIIQVEKAEISTIVSSFFYG